MTRECMDCKRAYGEKCAECGAEAVKIAGPLDYKCPRRHGSWLVGKDARPTTGLCDECHQKRHAAVVARYGSAKPALSRTQ